MLTEETVRDFLRYCMDNLGIKMDEIEKKVYYSDVVDKYELRRKGTVLQNNKYYALLKALRDYRNDVLNTDSLKEKLNPVYDRILHKAGNKLKAICKVSDSRQWIDLTFAENEQALHLRPVGYGGKVMLTNTPNRIINSVDINGKTIYYAFNPRILELVHIRSFIEATENCVPNIEPILRRAGL